MDERKKVGLKIENFSTSENEKVKFHILFFPKYGIVVVNSRDSVDFYEVVDSFQMIKRIDSREFNPLAESIYISSIMKFDEDHFFVLLSEKGQVLSVSVKNMEVIKEVIRISDYSPKQRAQFLFKLSHGSNSRHYYENTENNLFMVCLKDGEIFIVSYTILDSRIEKILNDKYSSFFLSRFCLSKKYKNSFYVSCEIKDSGKKMLERRTRRVNYITEEIESTFGRIIVGNSPPVLGIISYISKNFQNEEIVVCGQLGNTVSFFNGKTGEHLTDRVAENKSIIALYIHRNRYLAFGSRTGVLEIYDLKEIEKEILDGKGVKADSSNSFSSSNIQKPEFTKGRVFSEPYHNSYLMGFACIDHRSTHDSMTLVTCSKSIKVVRIYNLELEPDNYELGKKDLFERIEYLVSIEDQILSVDDNNNYKLLISLSLENIHLGNYPRILFFY